MEFRILGDLEVRAAGRRVEAGHARQRAVLAVLLFDLGQVVPVTRLIDRVWGDDPPASVRNVLYGYVANLRAVITRTGDPDVTLTRQSGGYRLDADRARFAPPPESRVPSTQILLWQKRLSDEVSQIRHGRTLRMAYTGMLMAGNGCVEVGLAIMPTKTPWPPTITECATAHADPESGS